MRNQTSFRLTTTLLPTDTTAKTTTVINKVDSNGDKFYPTFTEETVVLTNDDRTVLCRIHRLPQFAQSRKAASGECRKRTHRRRAACCQYDSQLAEDIAVIQHIDENPVCLSANMQEKEMFLPTIFSLHDDVAGLVVVLPQLFQCRIK